MSDLIAGKRQLVADLKSMLDAKFALREFLENKSIEFFKFSSATLAIVSVLGVTVDNISNNISLATGFAILCLVYLIQIYFIYKILEPSIYSIVPGIPRLAMTYEDFYKEYIEGGEEGYLDQMIVDLAGTNKKPGAIEDAEVNNTRKAQNFSKLAYSFVAMIMVLLIMGGIAVFS